MIFISVMASMGAFAQSFPAKPIRVVVPLAAGGPGDVLARAIGQKLSENVGQSVVIDNRPGANTNAFSDLLGGQISIMFPGAPIALPQVKAGKLRALGTTGAARTAAAPELLPIAEAGLPGYEISVWYGILAPAATPPPAIHRLHAEISRIVQLPEIRERWAALGAEPLHNTPEQFAAFLKADLGKWAKVVRDSGAKVD